MKFFIVTIDSEIAGGVVFSQNYLTPVPNNTSIKDVVRTFIERNQKTGRTHSQGWVSEMEIAIEGWHLENPAVEVSIFAAWKEIYKFEYDAMLPYIRPMPPWNKPQSDRDDNDWGDGHPMDFGDS